MYSGILRASFVAFSLAGISLAPIEQAEARDYPVCYKTKEYEPTRIVLDVAFHSRLPTTRNTGRQEVWDADGKHAYTDNHKNVMAVFDGSIVTSAASRHHNAQPKGAHLGGTSYFVRGSGGIGPSNGQPFPIFWECTSAESSPIPRTWYCTIRSENFNKNGLPVTLIRLRHPDKECDVFQDTYDNPPPPPNYPDNK